MKVFLDTNIIIDFYDRREQFYTPAAVIFDLAYKGKIKLYVSAVTFVNAFFLLRKAYSRHELYNSMRELASLCKITETDEATVKKCLDEERTDFEDAVQYESAMRHNVDVVVTRNVKDFSGFAKNVLTPTDFLNQIVI